MGEQEREKKGLYLNNLDTGEDIGQELGLDGVNSKLRMNNKGHNNNSGNKKQVMLDFAMIKGNLNLKDFLKDKSDLDLPIKK
jgi:hypothetical protein